MDENIKIGICYTTRNRCDVLDLCLEAMMDHLPKCSYEFWVIDDASDNPERNNYEEILRKYPFVKYHKNPERLGIAKAKNECLKRVSDCDYIFLLDDDVFFKADGVYDFMIDASVRTGVQHFLYMLDIAWIGNGVNKNGVKQYPNCSGVCLFITKQVIEKVGGFDDRMGIYGHEHVNYTKRIHAAGLMNGYGENCSLDGIDDYIFSLDLDMNCLGRKVPHRPDFHQGKYEFVSSMEGEQDRIQEYINHNAMYLHNYGSIFKEIK